MFSNLDISTLVSAYSQGYFPMPHPQTQQIQWFRPDLRAVLPLNNFHISRSFKRFLAKTSYEVSIDKNFSKVMYKCSLRPDTWINKEFIYSYNKLNEHGLAHSIEIFISNDLIGGVYGVCLGGAFFAESMFSSVTNGSKIALMELVRLMTHKGMKLLECQFLTPHLKALGACEISDREYIILLNKALKLKIHW